MRKTELITLFVLLICALVFAMAAADRLPNQTPENQVFTVASSVEAIGSYSGSQELQWAAGFDPEGSSAGETMYNYRGGGGIIMGPDTYLYLHNQLVRAGGWDDGAQYHPNWWFIHNMNVPESLLDTGADPDGQDTYRELGEMLVDGGASLQIIPGQATAGHGGLHTGILDPNEVRATTAYSEMTETNGGYVSETKTFDPDTRNKAFGLFNVESTKTFTYATDANTGSIAQTAEMIATDNMGAPTPTADVVACPFGPSQSEIYPAFCNVVYAKSMSQGVTSAAQSSSAQVRMVAASADVPAELNYNFDVKPDASAGVGYAMGTFGTEFGVSIKEGRGNGSAPSATLVYTDKATVAGMVAKLSKQYASKSGFSL